MSETHALASYIVNSRPEDIPADVWHEAKRALVNYVGCAVGGCREPAVDIALRALSPYAGPASAVVLGRPERLDPLYASLMNGISAHVHDYDDTTPKNYGHLTAPTASALFAYASVHPVTGRDFMHAFVLGFEASSRVANAVYPAHYDVGWHMTGTAGVFGAAAAIGKLIGLNVSQMVWALGLAATQAAGLREMFGSMGKPFHPGRSAQNGYTAALLAQAGFSAGVHGIEGPRGFAAVLAAASDLSKITERLGEDFDLRANTYKPFPCGIVNHPTIEAAIHLHDAHALQGEAIAAVNLRVAPLVLDLCNKQFISTGLEGRFSVYHGAAVGLVRGKARLQEYSDASVNDPTIRRVRELAVAEGDSSITEDQARVRVTLRDGHACEFFVAQSLGNVHRPLSDRQLDQKLRDQAVLALPEAKVEALLDRCWQLDTLDTLAPLFAVAVP
ncbi:MAG: MmgE/PrpD family protein [Vicinamibacterales bacterium]